MDGLIQYLVCVTEEILWFLWSAGTGSGKGTVRSSDMTLPEQMPTQIYVIIYSHFATLS